MAKLSQKFDYSHLLNLIDGLRSRKARPDKTRIVANALRKYGVAKDETLMVLDAAIQDFVVLRVRYKDGYSYRNPGRSVKAKKSSGPNASSFNVTKHRLLLAVRRQHNELSLHTDGVTTDKIMQDLCPASGMSMEEQEAVTQALQEEVKSGCLIRLANGNFIPNKDDISNTLQLLDDESECDEDDATLAEQDELELTPPKEKEPVKKRTIKESSENVSMNGLNALEKKTDDATQTRGRPVSQRLLFQKIKKSLGPDFLDPSDLGYGYLRDAYEPKCCFCGNADFNQDLFQCKKCPYKAHLGCYKQRNPSVLVSTSFDECPECKASCSLCTKNGFSENLDKSVICSTCDKTFHVDCLELDNKPEMPWNCNECAMESEGDVDSNSNEANGLVASGGDDRSGVNSPALSPSAPKSIENSANENPDLQKAIPVETVGEMPVEAVNEVKNELVEEVTQPNVEAQLAQKETKSQWKDPSTWSVDQVAIFVNLAGFPNEATIFRENEIDGPSLMLLKREDILTGLNLKLGPAVKIYAHISMMQATRNAPGYILAHA